MTAADIRASISVKRNAEWVSQNAVTEEGRLPDPEFQRCVDTICAVGSAHNLGRWRCTPHHVEVRMPMRPLATYDGSYLTWLVVAAHLNRVRIELSAAPGGRGGAVLLIRAHPRSASTVLLAHHPGIERFAKFAEEGL